MSKVYNISMGLKRGQEYTLSVQLSSDSGEVEAYLGQNYYIGRTKNQKITFTMNRVIASQTLTVNTVNRWHSIERVKLEKGSKATDWTRAPEDDREYITSQIEISNEEIKTEIVNEVDGQFSEFTQTVKGFTQEVADDLKGVKTSVETNAENIGLRVLRKDFNGYNIASQITMDEDAMKLVAKNIDLTGKVTFSSFDVWTKKRIEDAESDASDAKEEAQEAKKDAKRADGWRYENTTEIDGGKIKAQTISANDIKAHGTLSGVHISGGTINIGKGNFRIYSTGKLEVNNGRFEVDVFGNLSAGRGGFRVPWNADGITNRFDPKVSDGTGFGSRWKFNDAHYIFQNASSIAFYQSGQSYRFNKGEMVSLGALDIQTRSKQNLSLTPSSGKVWISGMTGPNSNNTYDLGETGYRWSSGYINTINAVTVNESSDIRLKEDIEAIPKELVEHFKEVKPKMYSMHGQKQFGYIAQDVERALFKYAVEVYGVEIARRNKDVFNMFGQNESYLTLAYRQVNMIKDAEKDNEIAELKERLSKLERG